jgi:hypothetical protein
MNMKKLVFSIIIIVFAVVTSFAQSPKAFKYQALARDNKGNILANKNIRIKISILKESVNGSIVYSEEHAVQTNQSGVLDLKIGQGTNVLGNFDQIEWGASDYFVKIEIDVNGGNNFSFLGISQLLSVPYALYADKSGNGSIWQDNGNYISLIGKKLVLGDVFKLSADGIDRLPKLSVDGAIMPTFSRGTITNTQLDQIDQSPEIGEGVGVYGIFQNYAGDFYQRAFWGVVIDRNGGYGNNPIYYDNGVNPDEGSFAVRYRISSSSFRTDLMIRKNGFVGIGTTNPKSKLEVTDGDVYINNSSRGIILKSPNGNCWRVTIDNNGNFVNTSIQCP